MRTFDDLVRSGNVRHKWGCRMFPPGTRAGRRRSAQLRGLRPVAALQLQITRLLERSIENEFVPLGQSQGMGIMVWSPLGSGVLSGKYKPSESRQFGEGRLQTLKDSSNPAFQPLDRAEFRDWRQLRKGCAGGGTQYGAGVAINWVAGRPGVATVLVGATRKSLLDDNLGALDFELPVSTAGPARCGKRCGGELGLYVFYARHTRPW